MRAKRLFNTGSHRFSSAIGAADHIILSLSAQPVTSGTILTVDKVEIEKATVQNDSGGVAAETESFRI